MQTAQYTVRNVHVFVPVVLCPVSMPIFQIKRIISREKWFHYVVTFFFLKMPKIWVGRTTPNGEKRENGLSQPDSVKISFISIGNSMICSNIWHKYHE